ncbi:dodecin family protein [Tepidicaulis sp. LMO-SS28]|uniref:dodecin family protein n=1 Tax=Tepidicaulis sp. LMO-SS28 TaxID=3447455 RepID=UPI003EE01E19
MSVARHTEVTASGKTIEEAVSNGIERACETLEEVQQVWVKDIKALVENGRLANYRVDMKVTFVLKR